jgi:putative endonuclease
MAITSRRKFGDLGEKVAADFLKDNGYKILSANYQNTSGRRLGEIDLIAKDTERDEIVFVEVKTREMQKYQNSLPEENITYRKLRKMEKIANAYLRQNGLNSINFRFDAISVWIDPDQNQPKIKHISHL